MSCRLPGPYSINLTVFLLFLIRDSIRRVKKLYSFELFRIRPRVTIVVNLLWPKLYCLEASCDLILNVDLAFHTSMMGLTTRNEIQPSHFSFVRFSQDHEALSFRRGDRVAL